MDASPDIKADAADRVADGERGLDRAGGTVEHGQESVAGGVYLGSAETFEDLPDKGMMAVQQLIPGRVAHLGHAIGGPGDVSHQHRRQYPVTDRGLAPPAPAAPNDGHHRLVADDPV